MCQVSGVQTNMPKMELPPSPTAGLSMPDSVFSMPDIPKAPPQPPQIGGLT